MSYRLDEEEAKKLGEWLKNLLKNSRQGDVTLETSFSLNVFSTRGSVRQRLTFSKGVEFHFWPTASTADSRTKRSYDCNHVTAWDSTMQVTIRYRKSGYTIVRVDDVRSSERTGTISFDEVKEVKKVVESAPRARRVPKAASGR